jgi:hypothetical protein
MLRREARTTRSTTRSFLLNEAKVGIREALDEPRRGRILVRRVIEVQMTNDGFDSPTITIEMYRTNLATDRR